MSQREGAMTPDEAIALLNVRDGYVHTFRTGGAALIGVDWDTAEAEQWIREADEVNEAGDFARSLKHSVAARHGGAWVFFETREAP